MSNEEIIKLEQQEMDFGIFDKKDIIDLRVALSSVYNISDVLTHGKIMQFRAFFRKIEKDKIYRDHDLDWVDIQNTKLDLIELIYLNSGAKSIKMNESKDDKTFIDCVMDIRDQIDLELSEDSRNPGKTKKELRRKTIVKRIDRLFDSLCYILKRSSDMDQDEKQRRKLSLVSLLIIGQIMKHNKILLKDPIGFAQKLGQLKSLTDVANTLMGLSVEELEGMVDQKPSNGDVKKK